MCHGSKVYVAGHCKPSAVLSRLFTKHAMVTVSAGCLRSNTMVSGTCTIVKAPSDKREYETLHLRNGLSALLIYDPEIKTSSEMSAKDESCSSEDEDEEEEEDEDDEDDESEEDEDEHESSNGADADESHPKRRGKIMQTKKAAAAMCVSVGSFSDPRDAEGLAHFLEHMLFMGSSKFPDENEYDNFLAKHGGSSNAFTDMEHTCYHFDVNHLHLKPALDRFSQFFVSPLVKESSIAHEVQAVDSEFVQVLQSDSSRLNQIKCATADPNHPYNRFAWGNAKSLNEAINKCGNMREKLMQFYSQHYLASRMKLVVLGGEPLDMLKQWVVELFEDVPEGDTKPPNFTWNGRVWSTGSVYRMESVKDQHTLDLSWVLPCLNSEYLKKADEYVSHLIGHEGRGSLLKYLKSKGWATELAAGVGDDGFERSSIGYIFTVNITLTLCGVEKVFDIITSFFEFIKMLRENKPQEWIFEELKAVSSTNFRFAEEDAADDYVVTLAKNMHLYPEHHVIYGDYAYERWDPKLMDEILNCITPDGMRIDVLTKSFDRNAPEVLHEPWFGTPYTVSDVPEPLLSSWTNPSSINPELHIPEANEFITRDFSLREALDTAAPLPTLVEDEALCKVWYKLDQTFKTPRANIYLSITSGMDTVRSEVLSMLYILHLKDALNETLYMASVASLSSSLSSLPHRIELKLHGYNEKLAVLARKISGIVKTVVAEKDRFQVIKEELERTFRNANVKPLTHSGSIRLQFLRKQYWTAKQKLACLSDLSVEDMNEFIPSFFQQVHIEALCHGNLTKDEALDIVKTFKDVLESTPLPKESKPVEKMLKMRPKTDYVYNHKVANDKEENSVVEKYFQICLDLGAETVREKALADLFEQVVYEPFFNQLRTVEQLGYRVDCGSLYTHGVIGFRFRIMSPKYSPTYIHKRIDIFINKLQEDLKNMSEEIFQHFKDSLIATKMEKDNCMMDETDRYWEHVLDERYLFDSPAREAKALKDIQKKDLVEWYTRYIKAGGSMRRSMCVQVWGCKLKEEMERNKKNKKQPYKLIDNIDEFKKKAEFFYFAR